MKHLRQYIRRILLEKEMGVLSKLGHLIDTGEWGEEKYDPRRHRHPRLNDVVDVVNDAIEDVPRREMKDFLWGLNYDFANNVKIESRQKKLLEDARGFARDLSTSQSIGSTISLSRLSGEDRWLEDLNRSGDTDEIKKLSKRNIKDLFRKHADHKFLRMLDTVHWGSYGGLKKLVGKNTVEMKEVINDKFSKENLGKN